MEQGSDEHRPGKICKLDASHEDVTSALNVQLSDGSRDRATDNSTDPKTPATADEMNSSIPATGNDLTQDDEVAKISRENPQDGDQTLAAPKLSKNQLKKIRRKEEWEAGRGDRKIARKEKQKARKERKREQRRAADDTIAKETDGNASKTSNQETGAYSNTVSTPMAKPVRATQLPVTFVIDCSWNELMMEKELISLGGQLTRCYSDNHKSSFRAHLAVSSFGGELKERFNTVLERQYVGWKGVKFLESDFVDVSRDAAAWMSPDAHGGHLRGQFSKYEGQEGLQGEGEVIYLSSDAEETLKELKPYSVYIIGGLVDKNRYKGICHKKACERNVKTAKLPIGDFMQMASRYVLTVNHVNEIMLRWLEYGDWAKAFDAVIPKRKGGVLKEVHENDSNAKETDQAGAGESVSLTENPDAPTTNQCTG